MLGTEGRVEETMVLQRPSTAPAPRLQASMRSSTSRGGVVIVDPDGNVAYQENVGVQRSLSSNPSGLAGGSGSAGIGCARLSSSSTSVSKYSFVVPSPNELATLTVEADKQARLERLKQVRQQDKDKARSQVGSRFFAALHWFCSTNM